MVRQYAAFIAAAEWQNICDDRGRNKGFERCALSHWRTNTKSRGSRSGGDSHAQALRHVFDESAKVWDGRKFPHWRFRLCAIRVVE